MALVRKGAFECGETKGLFKCLKSRKKKLRNNTLTLYYCTNMFFMYDRKNNWNKRSKGSFVHSWICYIRKKCDLAGTYLGGTEREKVRN